MTEINRVEKPWGKGRVVWSYTDTANDSDWSFTVPAGKIWDVKYLLFAINCTATVGNRVLLITISNGTNLVWTGTKSGNIAATLYGAVSAAPTLDETSTTKASIHSLSANYTAWQTDVLPCPCLLPAGYVVRMYDTAAIDAAADDCIEILYYIEYDI